MDGRQPNAGQHESRWWLKLIWKDETQHSCVEAEQESGFMRCIKYF